MFSQVDTFYSFVLKGQIPQYQETIISVLSVLVDIDKQFYVPG